MLFGIIFYVLRYFKKYEFEIFGDLNNLENELANVNCDFDIYFYDLCDGYNYPPMTAPANNATPAPSPQLIVFLFLGVLLGILFEYVSEINNEINENECDVELQNINVEEREKKENQYVVCNIVVFCILFYVFCDSKTK